NADRCWPTAVCICGNVLFDAAGYTLGLHQSSSLALPQAIKYERFGVRQPCCRAQAKHGCRTPNLAVASA
ncbi:MAG: hypothetical protein MI924_15235, partial [Chloroflexales bacterium]|nr:hypothetical protein [Chloroflexales bacterium]